MNVRMFWKEMEQTNRGNRFSQYFIIWWRDVHPKRPRYTRADRSAINLVYKTIWETVRRHYVENEGGVCIRGLGYFCHVYDANMYSPNSRYMYGVRHDFSYYRMMLITPSMLTDYHYMVDTFYDDVEKAVSHHVNLGRHYRFLWRRAEEYLQSDVPRARKFRVVMAGTRRGMPYLGYEADKHKVQHSNSNRIRICRKINKIKYYARLNPDISQEEIDGKIAAARRRAREKATVTTMRQKQRVMELENSKTNWMYDRVRRMRVRSIKKIIGKYRRERMSAIWREEK